MVLISSNYFFNLPHFLILIPFSVCIAPIMNLNSFLSSFLILAMPMIIFSPLYSFLVGYIVIPLFEIIAVPLPLCTYCAFLSFFTVLFICTSYYWLYTFGLSSFVHPDSIKTFTYDCYMNWSYFYHLSILCSLFGNPLLFRNPILILSS